MGCCLSFNKKNPENKNAPSKPPLMPEPDRIEVNYNGAPPPCLEEETVKEVVLSENPLPKPQTPKEDKLSTHMPIIQEHEIVAKDLITKHEEEETSQVSQVSEIYSISESFSTTTTATTTTVALSERREDEADSKVTRREVSNYRSPAKIPRKRPNAVGAKSSAKRAETSRVISRPVPGRTMPRNARSNGVIRENGEGPPGRQSRSPATKAGGGGVGRRNPGKVTRREGGWLRVENKGKEEINDGVLKNKNESLDNPHVSLECFIFL